MGEEVMSHKLPGQLGKYHDSHNRGCMWIVALGGWAGLMGLWNRIQTCMIISVQQRCLGKYFISIASFLCYIFIMFHLSHAFYIQSYVCPILHSTLASCMGHKSNFHSLFLFNLFRKMIKKPRGLQEKGRAVVEIQVFLGEISTSIGAKRSGFG